MDRRKLEDLEDFVLRSKQINATVLAQTGIQTQFKVQFRRGEHLAFQSLSPGERDLRELAIVLRPFTAPKERINVDKVHRICMDHLSDTRRREGLGDARAQLKAAQRTAGVKVQIDEKEWTPGYVANVLINGYIAHWDRKKRQEWERVWPPMQMLLNTHFAALLAQTGQVVSYMAVVIDDGLVNRLFR